MAAGGRSRESSSFSELRVVMLGYKNAGKSSSGNTILGRKEFDLKRKTAQCVTRQGKVAGRQITVVEAPGWWINFNLNTTPEFTKEEIVLSVSLCPPGPHIFLQVIRVGDTFTEDYIRNIIQHVEFLGGNIWSHTMLLFTRGELLWFKSIEQYIEREKHLKSLMEKCGNRYHVIKSHFNSDFEITELLEKMEDMVAGNRGHHFEIDRKRLEETQDRRRKEEERVRERQMKVEKQRQHFKSLKRDSPPLSEFRVVLVGYRNAGKSSSGNTILGRHKTLPRNTKLYWGTLGLKCALAVVSFLLNPEKYIYIYKGRKEFDLERRTAQCVKIQGKVAGRQVTVVKAPGWWSDVKPKATPELTKEEIILSVSLCPPGPHSVLLVISLASLVTESVSNIQQHLELLGESVWSHTMVLFTYGDWLGDTAIEQLIESEGALQSLVEKCGNRYHVLNNVNWNDDQVTELLEKIEEMTTENSGCHFEMDRKKLNETTERRRKDIRRATERLRKVEKKRLHLQSLKRKYSSFSKLRVVMLGYRTAGKSSSGNTILGREEFDLKRKTAQCVKREGEVAGKQVTVVEAPGWWMNLNLRNTSELTKEEILLSLSLCPPGPHIFLQVIRVGDSFTEDYIRNIKEHVEFLSENIWSHTMLLFTRGDWLGDTTIEQYIESEKHLQCLVEECGNRYHVISNQNKTDYSQITELLEKIEEIVVGNRGRHFEMDRQRQEETQERRRKEEERVRNRRMKVENQRQYLQSLKRESPPLSEFRIVLLGYRQSGKSSSGNTILGREEFDLRRTAQCVKRQGDVAGRHVTVVEAPGWWINFNLKTSLKLTKDEIALSVSLCPPGPHIVLMLIRVAEPLEKEYITNITEHVQFLSENIWSHTMLLFTRGDWLGDTTIEQYIENEKHLQCLVEKCGNRYHVINNQNKTDQSQITELLEKIEEIVAGHRGHHFEMERKRLEEVKERREKEEERIRDRLMKVEKQRQHLQSLKRESPQLSEFRVVLLGYRTSGKSSSGNTILGREAFDPKSRTAQCVKRQGEVAGRLVTVVDTPGWIYNVDLKFTPELTKQEITLSVSLCPPGPHIILLVEKVSESFPKDTMRIANQHLELLGESVWNHTMVLFTYGDWLGDTTIEQYIESEGERLQSLVEKCGNRYHVFNNVNITSDGQITELLEKIEEFMAGNMGHHFEMDRKRLEETQQRRRKEDTARERLMKVKMEREHLQSLKRESPPLSEFRIVLLGYRQSGKSSSGNTILGREEFDLRRTAQCVKRQGDVAGRHVTVVEAPGWWINFNLKTSPKLTKDEIALSVSLCPPGPHIVLLLIRVAEPLEKEYITNITEHVQFLSENIWSHTMLLFTRGDWLGDTTIEQYIENEKHLQCLVEKCGNRYHVINNQNKTDQSQITELLEKIEEIVAGHRGHHFEMERKRLEEVKERREKEEERIRDRLMKVEKQRQHLQSLKRESPQLSEFRVVLLGYRTSGKSSSGNTILGREAFDPKSRTAQCVKRQGEVAGRLVTVVDTPGWIYNVDLKFTPELTKQEITLSVSLCPPGPHIILLVEKVSESFPKDTMRIANQHLELLGESVWNHTMVLFTHGDWLGDTTIEQYIESEGERLQSLVEKCGNRYHVLNNVNITSNGQITELLEKIEEFMAGNMGCHFEMDRKRLEETQQRKRKEVDRARERLMRVKTEREHLQSLKRESHPLSEFRIVLLGNRQSGKSSSGNTILGGEEFDLKRTAQCVKRQGEVAGRQVTVVEAPGWWTNFNLKTSPELTKDEITLSVSLCPPGPHIVLLLIRVAEPLGKDYITNITEHVQLFSENIWSHTMLLFTCGDCLGDTTIEQYIESEKHLQCLVEKCGNRYHVINNQNKTDHSQITELVEKIEEIVAGNGGRHFEMDRQRLEETQERRRKEEERVRNRLMKVENQRQYLQSLKRESPPISEFRVVLLGHRLFGKSSSGNTILGREEFDLKSKTAQCVKRQGKVAGRLVTVVDTPGWLYNVDLKFTPELTKQEIALSVSLCPPGPHIILLVEKVSESLPKDTMRITNQHLELLGESVWNHTMVLFTHGDWLGDTTIEQYIESEGERLQSLVEKCGNRYHVLNNVNITSNGQITELLEKIEEFMAGNMGCHFKMDRKRLEETQQRKRKEVDRARERLMRVKTEREHLRSLKTGESHPLSEFRIVLLGNRQSGKSSSGNNILGREEFDLKRTAQCIKRQGEVAGRQVTVVEAPGWWTNFNLKTSPELTKDEITLSVSLCPPGPHIVLLLIRIAEPLGKDYITNITEHVQLFSENIWSHTMLLFTCGDCLGDTTIEQYIESEKHLQCLVEKCGNRYHVINNQNKTDHSQITELVEKIEEIVAGNGGRHFEMDRQRLEEAQERRRKEEERVRNRLMKVENQRQYLQSLKRESSSFLEFRVVMLGYKNSGKSSSGNTILGREEFDLTRRTAQCVKRQKEVAGRHVTVVEAPGWWKDVNLKATPNVIKQEIVLSVSLCPPGPHIFLLLIRIADSFTDDYIRNIKEHVEFLSENIWSHTMLLFTFGDWLGDTTIEQYIESEKPLQWLVEKCDNRYHVINNHYKTDCQITQLVEKIEEIVVGNRGRHFEMDRQRLEETQERRRKEEERVRNRLMKVENQRQHLQSLKRQSPISEFRVVLLGNRQSGKSSTGNTILGREEFDLTRRTAQCVKRQGEVAGRQVTVVKAPGWLDNVILKDTPEMTKEEIMLSVSLCPPGPHAVFIIIQTYSCVSAKIANIQQHIALLGERVWSHTMVLFTCGDCLGDATIEQHIESHRALQLLIEKCGNRYHVLNNRNRSDMTQITELLGKIEEMVTENSGRHFEMDRERLKETVERRRKEKERATERLMKVETQRLHLQSLKRKLSFLSEFRVVLLGYRNAGKSSSGNTILGREEFDLKRRTAQCGKRQGEVAGRHVTVVEAPGWWKNVNLKDTPNVIKQEIVLSVSLCPPGPHIFLLLIRIADAFTDDYIRNIKEHVEFLSENIWSHTMLLFTFGDWLGDTTIEQYIESEKPLQWLVEKCDNRYHVINNHCKTDCQITQLVEKIEEIIAGSRGHHFEMDRKRLEEMQERRIKQEERGRDREMKVERQRQHLQSLKRELPPISEFRVVLLGSKQSGKSSSGNTILGREKFHLKRTAQCVKRQGEVAARQVTVVDAPGWWDIFNLRDTPEITKEEIVLSVSLCPPGPHAVLLVIKMYSCVSEEKRSNIQQHLELLSDRVWNHTMVLFTYDDWLGDTTIEQYIESDGALQSLVEKCGNRYHVLNNVNWNDDQVTQLLEKIEEVLAENSGHHFEMERKRQDESIERRKEEERQKKDLMMWEMEMQHILPFMGDDLPDCITFITEHLEFLGENAWYFLIDKLGLLEDARIKQRIESNYSRIEENLQNSAETCMSLCHLFKNLHETDKRQLTDLLNNCLRIWFSHFEVEQLRMEATQEAMEKVIIVEIQLCQLSRKGDDMRKIKEHLECFGKNIMNLLSCIEDCLGGPLTDLWVNSDRFKYMLRYYSVGCQSFKKTNMTDNDSILKLPLNMMEVVARNSSHKMDRKRLEETQDRRKKEEERVRDRLMKVEKQRTHLLSLKRELPSISEFRVVLLGSIQSGKSSSGNTILGREEFDLKRRTAQCVKRQGEVAGRQVTVVDTPGWWINTNIKNTPELTKEEIVLSVSLCPPGPNIILLLIRVADSIREDYMKSIQQHLELLSENVWSHTMVVFTRKDWLANKSIEQYIESKEQLRYLVEKCGNRYHVFNNHNKTDGSQITQLLEKIEENFAGNRGNHFEIDRKRLADTKERRRKEEERKRERLMNMEKQRLHLQSLKKQSPPMLEFRVVLLGYRSAGKSSSGNTILGREEFDLKRRIAQCVKRQGEVAGRHITVVEAPGWWKNVSLKDTPELTKNQIMLSVSLCPPGPHIFLLLIEIGRVFTRNDISNIQEHLEFIGDRVWNHTMVLFTGGDWLGDTTIEQYIETEGPLQSLVEKCGNSYHVLNNINRSDVTQITQLLEKIEEMVAGNSCHHFNMDRKRQEETQARRIKEEKRVKERLLKTEKQRLYLQSLKQQSPPMSEFRVVLLGHRGSAKSSSGNTILGREEFDLKRRTAQCVKRHGEVAGRHVTVIEAPGWWKNFNLKSTPELTKQEIMLSVSLHLPRPHMVLLLIPLAYHLTKNDITNIQEHLEFISNTVWSYTMVLFSHGDWLGNTTIEQYIESDEHLRYLVKKCENRYHVLNNKSRDDDQITELLEKIEEIVAGNGGNPFELDKERQKEIEKQVKQQSGRVENREMKVYKQRTILQFSFGGDIPHLPEVRIVLLGYKNSGKSSLGNTILGRDEFQSRQKSIQSVKRQGEVAGRKITVVEAPGWWFNVNFKDTPEDFKLAVKSSVSLCHPGPHAILLLICLDLSHTEQDVENIQDHLEILGKSIQSHTMVLFTHGDWLGDTSIEGHIETERPLQYLVDFCRNRYHVFNNRSRDATQVTELLCKIEEMVAENGGSHYETDSNRSPYRSAPSDSLSASDASSEEDSGISAARSMMDPPNLGGDNRSDITSVSSASCKPISDTASEAPSEGDSGISAARSMMDPPNLGGDDRSDITSVSSASEDLSQTPKTLERNRKLQKVKEGKVISTDQGEIAQEDSQSFSQTNTV